MSSQDQAHIQYVPELTRPFPAKDNNPNLPRGSDAVTGAVQAQPGLQQLDASTAAQLEQPLCT